MSNSSKWYAQAYTVIRKWTNKSYKIGEFKTYWLCTPASRKQPYGGTSLTRRIFRFSAFIFYRMILWLYKLYPTSIMLLTNFLLFSLHCLTALIAETFSNIHTNLCTRLDSAAAGTSSCTDLPPSACPLKLLHILQRMSKKSMAGKRFTVMNLF